MKAIATLAILSLTAAVLHAQTNAPAAKAAAAAPPPAAPSAFEKFTQDTKKPTDWLTWDGDLRVRNEYFNNAISLTDTAVGHEQDVIRFRGRLWATATPVDGLSFNTRLSAEPREFLKPSFASSFRSPPATGSGRTGMEWRYGIFDILNLKWTNAFNQPLSITAGRQDIMFGDYYDWWLVLDGTPGDGSWTFFLDSVRVSFDAKELKTKFDLIALYQSARPGDWLPTLDNSGPTTSNPSGYGLTEQNEAGAILYASNKSLKNTQIDGYFIYKGDSKEFANGDNADIYTLGAKVTGTPAEHWQYSVEGAYQFGTKEDRILGTFAERDIRAYGGKLKASYLFKDKLNNQVSLVGEFLSGDDPNTTGTDEMFDVLWGRWPRWSELYIYSYIMENGGKIAQLNNLGRIGPSWTLSPIKNMSLSVMYNALFAPEDPSRQRDLNPALPGVQNNLFSYDGNFRGHYLQTVLKHTFNKHLNAHLWAEFVWEGDYYAQRDMMSFLRGEVYLTW
jgi:hypothetical protein